MFLNIEGLEPHELRRLEMMFGKRLSAYHNPYYQICVEEILCAIENEMDDEDLDLFKSSPLFGTYVSEMAQYLYEMINPQLDDIYEKAVSVVRNNIEE